MVYSGDNVSKDNNEQHFFIIIIIFLAKKVPVAYGLCKLEIGCVVEDDKIGIDFLEEKIGEFDEYVQGVDIVYFGKI